MKTQELLKLVVDKVNKTKQLVNEDYTKGRITAMERHSSIVYLEQLKLDVQSTLDSMSKN